MTKKTGCQVVGVDLSLTGTGYVCLSDETLIDNHLISTKPNKNLYLGEIERLNSITYPICESIIEHKPEVVVIEGMAFMANQSTALMQLAGLNYLLRNNLYRMGVPFIIVAPTTLKKFVTGKGNSPKDVMILETYKKWNVSLINDNVCDAYGLAQIGMMLVSGSEKTKNEHEVMKLLKPQLDIWKSRV